jgi:hypothetical protein
MPPVMGRKARTGSGREAAGLPLGAAVPPVSSGFLVPHESADALASPADMNRKSRLLDLMATSSQERLVTAAVAIRILGRTFPLPPPVVNMKDLRDLTGASRKFPFMFCDHPRIQ